MIIKESEANMLLQELVKDFRTGSRRPGGVTAKELAASLGISARQAWNWLEREEKAGRLVSELTNSGRNMRVWYKKDPGG